MRDIYGNDDELDREALLGQMGGMGGRNRSGGIAAGTDLQRVDYPENNRPDLEPVAGAGTAPAGGGNPRDFIMGLLKDQAYGPEGLAAIEKQLTDAGYRVQKHSDGRVRGRVLGPDSRAYDVIGEGEGQDWWNNKTGSGWGFKDMGVAGPSGSVGGGYSPPPPSASPAMSDGVAAPNDDFFTQLVRQLRSRAGGTSERDMLLNMMGTR